MSEKSITQPKHYAQTLQCSNGDHIVIVANDEVNERINQRMKSSDIKYMDCHSPTYLLVCTRTGMASFPVEICHRFKK